MTKSTSVTKNQDGTFSVVTSEAVTLATEKDLRQRRYLAELQLEDAKKQVEHFTALKASYEDEIAKIDAVLAGTAPS